MAMQHGELPDGAIAAGVFVTAAPTTFLMFLHVMPEWPWPVSAAVAFLVAWFTGAVIHLFPDDGRTRR